MSKMLCIEVVDLERAVVHMCRLIGRHEETMMIDEVLATIDVRENCYITFSRFGVGVRNEEEIRRHNVEVACIKLNLCREIGNTEAKVSKLEGMSAFSCISGGGSGRIVPCAQQQDQAGSAGTDVSAVSRSQSLPRA